MNKFKESMAGSIIVLALICFVVTLGLSFTYTKTKDVIEANKSAASFGAFETLVPDATTFTPLEITLPEGVSQAVVTDTGQYVFVATGKGYGGDVTFIVATDADGKYTAITMPEGHMETPGIGTRAGEPEYLVGYYGSNDPNVVDGVAGATKTSQALKTALDEVNKAFALI